MHTPRRILIAPIDWGLGHAARCIPIINSQLEKGNVVILAANGRAKGLLKRSFPHLSFLPDPPDYAITYNKRGSWWIKMWIQLPHILSTIKKENVWLFEMKEKYNMDEVISDNRYGLHHPNVRSVVITHQTAPLVPSIFQKMVNRKIKKWLEKFDECWIPDYKDESTSLAGLLSHRNVPNNARYVGPLSRFTGMSLQADTTYTKVAVISGPEPSRSLFLEKIKTDFLKDGKASLIVCGLPEESFDFEQANIRVVAHLDDKALGAALKGAKEVYSRSGYSSLMDYHVLNVAALHLTPTPGQTEQIYLAQK